MVGDTSSSKAPSIPEPIVLLEHRITWAHTFEQEAVLLKAALNSQALRSIHHVGSTAIASIKAKPIVDIAIESPEYPPTKITSNKLLVLGYQAHGEAGVDGRHLFTKGHPRTINLHWCPENGTVVQAQIRFRNILNKTPKLAKAYENLKTKASHKQHIDSPQYADAKTDFINEVLQKQ